MEREANLPPPPSSSLKPLPSLSLISSSSTTASASSVAAPPSDFRRQVQAAFKRIRPHGKIQASGFRARRILVPGRESLKTPASDAADLTADTDNSLDLMSKEACVPQESIEQRKIGAATEEGSEDSSVTKLQREEIKLDPSLVKKCGANPVRESQQPQQISSLDFQKGMQCSSVANVNLQRAYEQMGTRKDDDLSSHLSSLGLTEMEMSGISCQDRKQREFQLTEMSDISSKSDGGMASLLAKRKCIVQDQHHQFPTFLGKDASQHPITQSSIAAFTCATTTSVHSRSAPLLNYTTYSSGQCRGDNTGSHMEIEPLDEVNINPERVSHQDSSRPAYPISQSSSSAISSYATAAPTQVSISSIEIPVEGRNHGLSREQQDAAALKESDRLHVAPANPGKISCTSKDKLTQAAACSVDTTSVQSQAPVTKSSTSDVKMESSKPEKSEKAANSKGAQASRKKNYDPDLFFKVNGKLYQKLGRIGTGGSSEVYKVISADCTIYALKKIKLKGRDYSTAYGFCQEIEYLTRLKGKNNIIQLIDYEVTDKTLLAEVLNGSKNVKDSRIRDDGYIYMVLEYGEIDLAHMLSQKWKEMDGSNWNIDENWLRFYWQQILQAVNTIHEERIVHSDLKPANFLLVRGSLKLIDFGIAKAIMSDTTNIQRDSQVGTLSYMSPEAFMCNENDTNGNPIKCGRPSDIWSLGCILYQMVYGRTPFSDYKTFWAKFKVITDRNHEIMYGPVSNPWLIDLLKKCLAWERNERWRIPQLLQHPFLVPPLSSSLPTFSSSQDQGRKLFQQLAEACARDDESSRLCFQLQQLLSDPVPPIIHGSPTSLDQHCNLLSQMSSLCSQLHQQLTILAKDGTHRSM